MSEVSGPPPRARRRPPRTPRPRRVWLRTLRLAAAVHPWRCAAIGAGTLVLFILIVTTSLPMALAERHPALALALHPEHPRALLALAREERARLTTATTQKEEEAAARAEEAATAAAASAAGGENAEDAGASPAPADDADTLARQEREHAASLAPPEAAEPDAPDAAVEEAQPSPTPLDLPAMRAAIGDLATRILAGAPLEASAWRLKGDTSDDLATSRQAMLEAVARSRRETVAAFWLMHQDYEQRDYAGVVRMADVLLRTRPALNEYTLTYLSSLSLTPEGREALVAALIENPSWRGLFLRSMGGKLAASDAPLALFQSLKDAGSPPGESELVPLLRARMAAEKRASGAYNIWLQMLPEEEVLKVRPVNNLDFAENPSSLPFNWNLPRSVNAFIDLQRRSDDAAGRVLRIRFGVGRVRLGSMEQVTFLRPGTYSFSGEQKGLMSSKRGIIWQVLCFPSGPVAGQSSQLLGAPRTWRPFSFEITIPANGRCDAQRVRMVHDSRSTSEQFASGEIQFQSLQIAPLEAAASGG
ncbi:hypothetical protein EV667_4320 [Ancylobacter aquaticus]|uniref:Uncharacterized protein n=1 Tax=Ancylobacter aquaticus TaxID=100 RepID=A0A4R1H4W0_ANCAQ|nr:hypothetical protein [Ancylobacter aquaticus]TCK16727.1 hypothetical protein EV667_4320 [Ancylobacter aquaticus]